MKKLTTDQIRQMFLSFFEEKGHEVQKSMSLMPVNDNSILFINSGIATLKKYFDGSEVPNCKRIANSQKAIRTNDIENVGVTSRHHTLFEMLGNFSIGDYFKDEAIEFAWEFLTSDKYMNIDPNKLYITIHPDDRETYNKWISMGVEAGKIVDLEYNFWEIGPGPGGPNTEIFYDRGEEYDNRDVIEMLKDDVDNDRIIEIWNLVFSQYNCDPDNKSRQEYDLLPNQNIDTGLGLERLACLSQDVETNFEIDIFITIIEKVLEGSDKKYEDYKLECRVIADHVRALTFAIADGILPASDGRGYVLRRLLRRSVKYGYMSLGKTKPFLYKLVDEVIKQMESFYPYLHEHKDYVMKVIRIEEEKFYKTLKDGISLLNQEVKKCESNIFSGKTAFVLYDTFGFPLEITQEILANHNLSVNIDEYNNQLELQRQRGRENISESKAMQSQNSFLQEIKVDSKFIGYDNFTTRSKVVFLTDTNKSIETLSNGSVWVILDNTPFYAESGGQVGDTGKIGNNIVENTIKLPNGQHAHLVNVVNQISVGDMIDATIDIPRRLQITQNHSVTHLLHYALHKFVSKNANQSGSLQDFDKTRFDFTNLENLTEKQLGEIEDYINTEIHNAREVITEEMSVSDAKDKGAQALFGEKYGDTVRVVTMGDSIELCGGTHVKNTSDIVKFHILSESGIGSGIRRIEAITGSNIERYKSQLESSYNDLSSDIRKKISENKLVNLIPIEDVIYKISRLNKVCNNSLDGILVDFQDIKNTNEELKLSIRKNQEENNSNLATHLLTRAKQIDGVDWIDELCENIDMKKLREVSDDVINQIGEGVVILRIQEDSKVSVIVKVSESLTSKYSANDILQSIITEFDGRGGGKKTMAQGGYTLGGI